MAAQGPPKKVLARVSGKIPAVLTSDGWEANDLVLPILNAVASLENYGPSDGDPIVRATNDAAKFLHGTAEILVRSQHIPGAIY